MTPSSPCPLCSRPGAVALGPMQGRDFMGCDACGLLFVDPAARLDPEAERARYETHENDPADPRYRAFLAQLAEPLQARLEPGASGLDYGSGPGPTLSVMLGEAGYPTACYDPFFAPDPGLLEGEARYDFISCTETAEHFHAPGREFERLARLLRPGGWLGLMTEPVPEDTPLEVWYYLRDPTHVVFYREETLAWLATTHGWAMERVQRRVTLFRNTDAKAPLSGFRPTERSGPRPPPPRAPRS